MEKFFGAVLVIALTFATGAYAADKINVGKAVQDVWLYTPVDVGIEQGLWRNRARVRAAYFNNDFSGLIEYVSKTALPQLGVPPELAAAPRAIFTSSSVPASIRFSAVKPTIFM